jgi:multimeric flavodoxin WrbA
VQKERRRTTSMSKKVFVISASPRRSGNSDTLCNEFIRGAKETGNEVEKVFICDKKIGYCTGCSVCSKTNQCVQQDDMQEILDNMVNADSIVMATPVYFYTMNAQLKTLIDRTVPRYTEIKNKEFYFIMTAADTEQSAMDRTLNGLRGFTEDCLTNSSEKGIIYGTGAWHVGEIKKSPAMQQAYEMGKHV